MSGVTPQEPRVVQPHEPVVLTFGSRTPDSFTQILGGLDDIPEIGIRGVLYLPAQSGERFPLVLMSIGSRGLGSGREEMYAEALRSAGMAVLVVDGNTPRGIRETVSDQGVLPWPTCAVDMLFALRHMLADPRVDARRAALLGYSRGGCVSVMAYDDRLQGAVLGSARFAAHVALYPPCYIRWRTPQPTAAPLLMILGGRDDLAPAAQGRDYAAALDARGGRVEILELPEAHHSFDAAGAARRDEVNDNLSARLVLVEDDGEMIEQTTGLRAGNDWAGFLRALAAAPGGRRGGTSGSGPLPRDVALEPIVAFLRRTLSTDSTQSAACG